MSLCCRGRANFCAGKSIGYTGTVHRKRSHNLDVPRIPLTLPAHSRRVDHRTRWLRRVSLRAPRFRPWWCKHLFHQDSLFRLITWSIFFFRHSHVITNHKSEVAKAQNSSSISTPLAADRAVLFRGNYQDSPGALAATAFSDMRHRTFGKTPAARPARFLGRNYITSLLYSAPF